MVVGSSLSAAGHDFNHVYGDQFSTSKQTSVSGIYITFEKSKSTELRALLRGSLLGLFRELLQVFYILLETSGSLRKLLLGTAGEIADLRGFGGCGVRQHPLITA